MKPILNSFSSPFLWLRFSPQHQLCLQAGAGCQIAHGLPLAGEPQWTRMPQCVHCCRVCQHNAQVRLPARWDYTHRCKELPLQLGLITDHCVVLNCNQSPACKLHKVCAPCIFVLNCQQTGPLSILIGCTIFVPCKTAPSHPASPSEMFCAKPPEICLMT